MIDRILKIMKENNGIITPAQLEKRNTDVKSIDKVIDEIEKSEFVKELWTSYSEKYQYAKNIEFKEVINSIKKIEKLF